LVKSPYPNPLVLIRKPGGAWAGKSGGAWAGKSAGAWADKSAGAWPGKSAGAWAGKSAGAWADKLWYNRDYLVWRGISKRVES